MNLRFARILRRHSLFSVFCWECCDDSISPRSGQADDRKMDTSTACFWQAENSWFSNAIVTYFQYENPLCRKRVWSFDCHFLPLDWLDAEVAETTSFTMSYVSHGQVQKFSAFQDLVFALLFPKFHFRKQKERGVRLESLSGNFVIGRDYKRHRAGHNSATHWADMQLTWSAAYDLHLRMRVR